MNSPRWEDRACERIAARRRKIGELLADEQDITKQERLWNQLQHMPWVESFVSASLKLSRGERVVSEAEERRLKDLMQAALAGKSWEELQAMRAELTKPMEAKTEGSGSAVPYIADDSALPAIFFGD